MARVNMMMRAVYVAVPERTRMRMAFVMMWTIVWGPMML